MGQNFLFTERKRLHGKASFISCNVPIANLSMSLLSLQKKILNSITMITVTMQTILAKNGENGIFVITSSENWNSSSVIAIKEVYLMSGVPTVFF